MITTTKNRDEIIQKKEWHGIVSADFKFKVTSSEIKLDYKGPKIPAEEWHKLMSFFRWTYTTAHSEAQARGFIDPVTNKLFFWAFPQEAKTGMTSKEIPGEQFNAQRAGLPNAATLEYLMTVHHHCAASAFQSGGDRDNEERPGGGAHETGQEGLHITVGKMDEACHDIDTRFYFNGTKMGPSMANFWDIGDELRENLPQDLWDRIARHQMTRKVEMAFPEQWKQNYIEIKTPEYNSTLPQRYQGGLGYSYGAAACGTTYLNLNDRLDQSAERLVEELLTDPRLKPDVVEQVLEFFNDSEILGLTMEEAIRERYDCIDLKRLFEKMKDAFEEEQKVEEALATGASGVDKAANNGNGKRGKRGKRGKARDNVDVARTVAPTHGQSNDQGQHWDSDLNCWVDDSGYAAD